MALHQPALTHHHLPHWLGYVGLALIAIAVAAGTIVVVDRLRTSSQPAAAQRLVIRGANGGGIEYMGIPYTAPAAWVVQGRSGGGIAYMGIPARTGIPAPAWVVQSPRGGGIAYMGIPYRTGIPAPAWIIQGRNGGGIEYTGIPYPAPAG